MSTTKREHADFQSNYNSSKNFNTPAKDEVLKPVKEGEVKLEVNTMTKAEREKVADAMDAMRRGMENTPERVAQREEE